MQQSNRADLRCKDSTIERSEDESVIALAGLIVREIVCIDWRELF